MNGNVSDYEGRQDHIPDMKTPEIEVWTFLYPGSDSTLTISIPEFTCICPKTGLPDFATINVEYSPTNTCIELKSFKLYLVEYRNVGIFHEHLVNKILEDIVKACQPCWAKVEGIVASRGGIQTTVEAIYKKK